MYVEVIQRLLSRSIMLSVERVGGGQAYFRDAVIDRFWSQVNRDVLKNYSVNRDRSALCET